MARAEMTLARIPEGNIEMVRGINPLDQVTDVSGDLSVGQEQRWHW